MPELPACLPACLVGCLSRLSLSRVRARSATRMYASLTTPSYSRLSDCFRLQPRIAFAACSSSGYSSLAPACFSLLFSFVVVARLFFVFLFPFLFLSYFFFWSDILKSLRLSSGFVRGAVSSLICLLNVP